MQQKPPVSREQIDALLKEGRFHEAKLGLERLWRDHPHTSTAQFLLASFDRMREQTAPSASKRLAILRSFTVEPMVPLLKAAVRLSAGIDLNVWVGDFNTYAQELLAPTSRLYEYDPHAVILAVQTCDIAPELWDGYADLDDGHANEIVDRLLSQYRTWIATFRQRSSATLLVHTFDQPDMPRMGIWDTMAPHGQSTAVRQLNAGLGTLSHEFPGVYLFDYEALVARYGRQTWYDERKWVMVRLPVAANHLIHLATEWARYLCPVFGRIAKVLVTDLDNTLWAGVVGEDGPQGIRMDGGYPGAFHRKLQRCLLDLSRRGVLLAIASKNNYADALEVLEQHPDMLLRLRNFASVRCNWQDKAQNLREIAAELNVGLDSLVFLDDNPAERERIRQELPEVAVIELPSHAEGFERALREYPLFERLSISSEDRQRTDYYAGQRQREDLRQQSGSLEEFYLSLQQQVDVRPVRPEAVERVAQLTQKTNQFNLTTRRYTEAEVAALCEQPDADVFEIRVRDRFGDNGIVGACITKALGDSCLIDTLLLSCRVIGRTVETAILALLVDQYRRAGFRTLDGWFLATKKNAPASNFYQSHKFRQIREEGKNSLWSLELANAEIESPTWIELTFNGERVLRATACSCEPSTAPVCGHP